jgi:hypothetical protein
MSSHPSDNWRPPRPVARRRPAVFRLDRRVVAPGDVRPASPPHRVEHAARPDGGSQRGGAALRRLRDQIRLLELRPDRDADAARLRARVRPVRAPAGDRGRTGRRRDRPRPLRRCAGHRLAVRRPRVSGARRRHRERRGDGGAGRVRARERDDASRAPGPPRPFRRQRARAARVGAARPVGACACSRSPSAWSRSPWLPPRSLARAGRSELDPHEGARTQPARDRRHRGQDDDGRGGTDDRRSRLR